MQYKNPTRNPAESPDQHLQIWERVAHWWDRSVGPGGNGFHREIAEPVNDQMLASVISMPGRRVLELACGNGNYARHLAEIGCHVDAYDGCQAFIDAAQAYPMPSPYAGKPLGTIRYGKCDLTSEADLATLPDGFDAAVCTMAVMDFDPIEPLFRAVRQKVKAGAPFVFSVCHPCFNSGGVRMTAELINERGNIEQRFGVSVHSYLKERVELNAGILNQPEPHYMWHRPVESLLKAAFAAGWVVDGFEEPGSPPGGPGRSLFTWARRPELPVALFVRLR